MSQGTRTKLIADLERELAAPVMAFFCGDHPFAQGQIEEDVLRPLYDQLLTLARRTRRRGSKLPRIVLWLQSLGGSPATPCSLVSLIREFCDEFWVFLPFRAYSAATMLALGADKIVMTEIARLGPVDPSIAVEVDLDGVGERAEIAAQDVASYVSFVRHRFGMNEDMGLSRALEVLSAEVDPLALGRLERVNTHVRRATTELLALHRPPYDESVISRILEFLLDGSFVHGHGFARDAVSSLGLDVRTSTERESGISWRLLLEYEDLLGLNDPPDLPPEIGEEPELVKNDFPVAVLETTKSCRIRQGNLRITRIRDFQAMPAIELNPEVHIHLAYKDVNAALDPTQWPAVMPPPGLDRFIELVRPQVVAEVQRLAEAQLNKRAPEKGLMSKLEDVRWVTQPSHESALNGS